MTPAHRTLLERLGVERPVIQAGMAGGIARHELAAAVSEAGGLGTLGFAPAPAMEREVARARARTGKPLAVNLLLPFARRAHWRAAAGADLVVTFWGEPRRRVGVPWVHQCGSVQEALAARAAGADGVVVQGVEAGGHVCGTTPALELLERARAALPAGYPIWLAGGIATPADVRDALEAGAEAAVLGTRFLMTSESRAHPEYKARVAAASTDDTVLTELFGTGWAGAHRVLPNEATARWLRRDPRGPAWLRMLNRATAPLVGRGPQLPLPGLLTPLPATDDGPAHLVERGPLYAGVTAARIGDLRDAGPLTVELSGRATA